VPFCANCGAYSDEPVERCAICTPAQAPAPAPAPAKGSIASQHGKLVAGCLALVGGVFVGSTVSGVLFFTVAGLGGALSGASPGHARVAAIAIITAGLIGIVVLARSGKRRDVFLQVFLVSSLVTALGIFATCSTLFWSYKS